jgi:hypothetical protein
MGSLQHENGREGSGKQFKLYRSPAERHEGDCVPGNRITRTFFEPGTISFEVKNGETPGIIGQKRCGEVKAFFRSSPALSSLIVAGSHWDKNRIKFPDIFCTTPQTLQVPFQDLRE